VIRLASRRDNKNLFKLKWKSQRRMQGFRKRIREGSLTSKSKIYTRRLCSSDFRKGLS
jgi:hypothetical protein